MPIQFSKRKDDCMTCAFVNATGLGYSMVSESFKTLSTMLDSQPSKMFNMKRVSVLRALFSKKNLVVVYKVNGNTAHAMAVWNKRVIDNDKYSCLMNRSFMHIFLSRKILKVWSK